MKKITYIIFLLFLLIGCQREKVSEVGVSHNKTLIIPPTNELPVPTQKNLKNEKPKTNNLLVGTILDKTEAFDITENIIDEIDEKDGYKNDYKFYQWLLEDKLKN